MTIQRLLIRRATGLYEVLEPDDVYYLEAREDDTLVRRREADPLIDMRSITEMAAAWSRMGPAHSPHLRRRPGAGAPDLASRRGGDWEVRMDPPVNRVLPVSRRSLPRLLAALGAAPDS